MNFRDPKFFSGFGLPHLGLLISGGLQQPKGLCLLLNPDIFFVQPGFCRTLIRPVASENTTVWRYRNSTIVIIIIFYPRYQGSRGVWKKIRRKCVGVTITPGSPQTQKNHVAARR